MSSTDAKALIETAVKRFAGEVPALAPVKLTVDVELRGRGDVQHFRLQLPEIKVTKDHDPTARVHLSMRREFFNVMASEARVVDWIEAFTYGKAQASGPTQILQLIRNVVEKHEERARLRPARSTRAHADDSAAAD